MQNHIIASALIERDGKYLMVQEANDHSIDKCKGRWGTPGGHADLGENIIETALREVKEETGCDIELTNICQIGTIPSPSSLIIVFSAKIINEVEGFTSDEISATHWFTYEELRAIVSELRSSELVLGAIENSRAGITAPLDIVKIYPSLI